MEKTDGELDMKVGAIREREVAFVHESARVGEAAKHGLGRRGALNP